MLWAFEGREGSLGRVWSCILPPDSLATEMSSIGGPVPLVSGNHCANSPGPGPSINRSQSSRGGQGWGVAGSWCLLTKQLVGSAAFQGRGESLRASSVGKAKSKVKKGRKEGRREGGRRGEKAGRNPQVRRPRWYRASTGLDWASRDPASRPGPIWACQ